MGRPKKSTEVKTIDKGVAGLAAAFNPGAGLGQTSSNTPESALTVAAFQSRMGSMQPVQAYQMSIAARAAITAISNQISRCPIRLFDRKSGDEIIDGELFDIFRRPSPGWSQHQFVEECISWYNIENEISILIVLDNTGRPVGLLPICPTRLWVLDPAVVNETKEIKQWMYLWPSGSSPFSGVGTAQPGNPPIVGGTILGYNSTTLDARQLIFYHGFNPSSHIRGCSPLITGVNELSTNYYAARYNKELFVNGNFPHVLINVPTGQSEKQRKDLEQRFAETFSIANGQSHKTLFVSGTEVKVNEIGTTKEGDFLEMQKIYMQSLFMLYRVPAIEAGYVDRARYETADQEREIFLSQTLLPQIDMFSEVLQHQFVDPYYTFSKRSTLKRGQGKSIGKLMEKSLDYSLNSRQESDIVVVLDADELPLMSSIRATQWKAVRAMADSMQMSVNECAEELGYDIPYSKVRDQIFIPSTYQKIADSPEDDPKQITKDNLLLTEQFEDIQTDEPKPHEDAVDTETNDVEKKSLQKKLHTFLHTLRAKYLKTLEVEAKVPTLAELDGLINEFGDYPALKKECRKDCFNIRKIIKATTEAKDRVQMVKEYLNKKNTKYERSLVEKMI